MSVRDLFCSPFISLSAARLRELILTRARLHTSKKENTHIQDILFASCLFHVHSSLCLPFCLSLFLFLIRFVVHFLLLPFALPLPRRVTPSLPSPQHVGRAPLWSSPPITILPRLTPLRVYSIKCQKIFPLFSPAFRSESQPIIMDSHFHTQALHINTLS